jgi:hypothetical protein
LFSAKNSFQLPFHIHLNDSKFTFVCYRETPTSAGPNSFGKTKQGFCDAKKIFEKTMKKAMDSTDNSKKATE